MSKLELNDLLAKIGIDPEHVLVMRHRPKEKKLREVIAWLAEDSPDLFNFYQRSQGTKVENSMHKLEGIGHVASFIGHQPQEAIFVGLYSIESSAELSHKEYWKIPEHFKLREHGMNGFEAVDRPSIRLFDLKHLSATSELKGKLVVRWPGKELSWHRRAHKNSFEIKCIFPESAFSKGMPDWREISLSWKELQIIPRSWAHALAEWRGIYVITDDSDGRKYVGSAYGESNLLGRWSSYAATGHGNNKHLKRRIAENLHFSILQRVSPDMHKDEVVALEQTWKLRLKTMYPLGLNEN